MNEIIKIGNENIPVIEWKGNRVITTALLAEVYESSSDNIKKNFQNNKEHFEEGKHYFCLSGDELKGFKDLVTGLHLVQKNAPRLYLWTRRGASRHCKILGNDKAWEQFDNLEDFYFDRDKQFELPNTAAGQIQLLAQGWVELEQKVDSVNKDLQDFKQDMPLLALECQRITRAKNQKVVPLMGGKDSPAYKNNSLRGKVYSDIDCQLRREFGVDTFKAIKRSQCDLAVDIIKKYELPMALKEQIADENAQITI